MADQEDDFFKRTNIIPIQVELNSEYGIIEVQSLGFADHDQCLKILELLDTSALYRKLPELLDYIYQLGCDENGEKRYYAAAAISKLATQQPFHDLNDEVIVLWAKSGDPKIRNSASVALSQILKRGPYKSNVLMLLNNWISSSDNSMLIETALSTFSLIVDSHSDEALDAISTILKTGRIIHFTSASHLFGIVYENSPDLSIERLYSWLLPITNSSLSWMAGLLSLIYIRLEDATVEGTRQKVVEMIFNLWDNPIMPLHLEMQEKTTIKVEEWAREALAAWNKESPEVLNNYKALFGELYEKYKVERRNRLEFHLRRWEINREREQARASRRRGGNSLGTNEKVSYLDLMPQGLLV